MSGIYGAISFGNPIESIDISSMAKWNQAYGSDGTEQYDGSEIKVGCCLEKLSDKAKKSAPVLKSGKKVAVIDAVVYNREELLETMKIVETSEQQWSDEELLFCYIEKNGFEALKNVNGDFAGAIYEEETKKLFLFRDHMGVRPLFVYKGENLVAFSTDMRGLVALKEVDATISEEWIFKIVAGYSTIGTEKTELQNIFCVEPAEYISLSRECDGIKKEKTKYWDFSKKKIRLSSDEEYQKQLRELIMDAVRRRVKVVSGPVGSELSGGLDSGVISVLISKLGREGIYFSWSMDPDVLPIVENDERLVIEDICKQEGITCYYGSKLEYLNEKSIMADKMRQIGMEVDLSQSTAFRYALPPYINTLAICETSQFVSRNGSKVVFTGHGGDEGVSHRGNPYELYYHGEYLAYYSHFWQLTEGQPRRAIRALKHCINNVRETKEKRGGAFRKVDGTPFLLKPDFAAKFREEDMPQNTFAFDPKSHVKRGSTCNRLYNTSILGAYCGVRYMAPFMDYRVIDFAFAIPRSQYLKNRIKRYIYREAFKDMIPESLYNQTLKLNPSEVGLEKSPNWLSDFIAKKREVVEILDRDYWSKYLNFDEIDAWVDRGELPEEEMTRDKSILTNLFYCAMIQNLVKKAREI